MIQVMRTATLPWNSVDAIDESVLLARLPIPTRNDVDKCMNCPYEQCVDCDQARAKTRAKNSVGRPRILVDMEALELCLSRGDTARELSESLGISIRTAQRLKRRCHG